MNKKIYRESEALLKVREWKEEVRKETERLTHKEYLERSEKVAEKIKSKYQLDLPKFRLF